MNDASDFNEWAEGAYRTVKDKVQEIRETINKGVDEDIIAPVVDGVTKAAEDVAQAIVTGAVAAAGVGGIVKEQEGTNEN